MKSYTDLEQSKKLAEILPLESADMCYKCLEDDPYDIVIRPYSDWKEQYKGLLISNDAKVLPCWSIAALFSVLPTIDDEFEPQLHKSLDKYRCTYEGEEDSSGLWRVADNPIVACYEMIIKLNELKLL